MESNRTTLSIPRNLEFSQIDLKLCSFNQIAYIEQIEYQGRNLVFESPNDLLSAFALVGNRFEVLAKCLVKNAIKLQKLVTSSEKDGVFTELLAKVGSLTEKYLLLANRLHPCNEIIESVAKDELFKRVLLASSSNCGIVISNTDMRNVILCNSVCAIDTTAQSICDETIAYFLMGEDLELFNSAVKYAKQAVNKHKEFEDNKLEQVKQEIEALRTKSIISMVDWVLEHAESDIMKMAEIKTAIQSKSKQAFSFEDWRNDDGAMTKADAIKACLWYRYNRANS